MTNTSLVHSNSFGNNESVSCRKDFKRVDKKKKFKLQLSGYSMLYYSAERVVKVGERTRATHPHRPPLPHRLRLFPNYSIVSTYRFFRQYNILGIHNVAYTPSHTRVETLLTNTYWNLTFNLFSPSMFSSYGTRNILL